MKKKRFASYLLSGKVSTLPMMVNTSFADVTPTYTEVLSSNVSLIEMPVTGVRLNTTATSSTYGADAAICSTTTPTTMNVVVTGAKPGNLVYLVASSNKNDGSFSSVSSKILVGSQNFTVISAFQLSDAVASQTASTFANAVAPISIPINIASLQSTTSLVATGTFYLQSVVFSKFDSTMWSTARFSELDTVVVSTAGCASTYGTSY
jgi:hypothetical protein